MSTFEISSITGWDAVLWHILPTRAFARHAAKKLLRFSPESTRLVLPNGAAFRVALKDGAVEIEEA